MADFEQAPVMNPLDFVSVSSAVSASPLRMDETFGVHPPHLEKRRFYNSEFTSKHVGASDSEFASKNVGFFRSGVFQ